jgi:polar amino acid transport system substrate-binding protein
MGVMYIIKVLFVFLWLSSCYGETYHLATGEFPPFTGAQLESQGLATKIIKHTIKKMGLQAKIEFLPWKRGYSNTLSGKYFGTFAYSKNKKRQEVWHYSKPLYQLQEIFFSQTKKNFSYESKEDLKGLIVCKPIGYNLFNLKKLVDKQFLKIARPPEMKNCFGMLKRGRVDLVMTNKETGLQVISQAGLNKYPFTASKKAFVDIGHHLIVPKNLKNSKKFITHFNEALEKAKTSGIITKFISQYIK